jgi:hypothetical protein
MKIKLFPFFIISFCMFFFTACPGPEDPDTLDVNPSILTFSSIDEEEQYFDVITNVPEWDVKVLDGEWITTRKEGTLLFVKVEKYTSTSRARTATITIKAGLAKDVNVTVEQSAMNSLSLNPSSIIYKVGEIGDKAVTVTTNASSWKAESTAEWLKITQLNNSLRISVNGANSGASDRTAEIIISAGTAQTTLTVTQERDNSKLLFEDIVTSSYSATATSHLSVSTSWAGELIPMEVESNNIQYYKITNWANTIKQIYLDFKDGEIFIDNYTELSESISNSSFRAFTTDGQYWTEVKSYKVNYNKTTRTFDFSNTYNGSQVYVGVITISGTTITLYPHLYTNVKLVLSPLSTSSAQFSGEALSEKAMPNVIYIDGKKFDVKLSIQNF